MKNKGVGYFVMIIALTAYFFISFVSVLTVLSVKLCYTSVSWTYLNLVKFRHIDSILHSLETNTKKSILSNWDIIIDDIKYFNHFSNSNNFVALYDGKAVIEMAR